MRAALCKSVMERPQALSLVSCTLMARELAEMARWFSIGQTCTHTRPTWTALAALILLAAAPFYFPELGPTPAIPRLLAAHCKELPRTRYLRRAISCLPTRQLQRSIPADLPKRSPASLAAVIP